MALTSYDSIIAELVAGSGQTRMFTKSTASPSMTLVAGAGYSLWFQGTYPPAGTPGAGAAGTFTSQTSSTTGALGFTNPGGGDTLHIILTGAFASAASMGTLLIYDRVGQIESLPLTGPGTTGPITTTIARYTTAGTMLMAEVTTATVATTAPVWNVSKYTNQAGTANQATPNMTLPTGTVMTGRLGYINRWFVDLAQGDTGVRSVEEYTLTTATATAGAKLQLVFAKPLVQIPISAANLRVEADCVLATISLPKIEDNACLAFAVMPASTSAQVIHGDILAVAG